MVGVYLSTIQEMENMMFISKKDLIDIKHRLAILEIEVSGLSQAKKEQPAPAKKRGRPAGSKNQTTKAKNEPKRTRA